MFFQNFLDCEMSKVLIIDDDPVILKILHQALSQLGYSVETASQGAGGIKKFQDSSYDVVITDIDMPGLNGYEVINHIRKSDRASTPVIAISGGPVELEKTNFNVFVSKPFSISELVKSVRSFV